MGLCNQNSSRIMIQQRKLMYLSFLQQAVTPLGPDKKKWACMIAHGTGVKEKSSMLISLLTYLSAHRGLGVLQDKPVRCEWMHFASSSTYQR